MSALPRPTLPANDVGAWRRQVDELSDEFIAEMVGNRSPKVLADTYTHVLINEREWTTGASSPSGSGLAEAVFA